MWEVLETDSFSDQMSSTMHGSLCVYITADVRLTSTRDNMCVVHILCSAVVLCHWIAGLEVHLDISWTFVVVSPDHCVCGLLRQIAGVPRT